MKRKRKEKGNLFTKVRSIDLHDRKLNIYVKFVVVQVFQLNS